MKLKKLTESAKSSFSNPDRSEILTGKIDYNLEDFLEDLRKEVKNEYSELDGERSKQMLGLVYAVLFRSILGQQEKELNEKLGSEEDVIKFILENHEDAYEVLKMLLQGKYLKNLRDFKGRINTGINLTLLNSELHNFHCKHKL